MYTQLCAIAVAVGFVAQPACAQRRGGFDGVAYDSIHMRPLVDATIIASIAGTGAPQEFRAVRTDRLGHFQFDSLPGGTYVISAEHAMLDSLGLSAETRASATDGVRTPVFVATPSRRSLMHSLCAAAEQDSTLGILLGVVRDGRHDAVVNAKITVAWNELAFDKATASAVQHPLSATVTSDERGIYRACGVPTHTMMLVTASRGEKEQSSMSPAEVSSAGLLVQDLVLRKVETSGAAHVLTGRVQRATGEPVSSARVSIGTTLAATTDEHGAFRIPALPAGISTIEVTAIGFDPHRELLDMPDRDTTLAIMMEKSVVVLDSVMVRALARAEGISGFEARRKSGNGHFVTAEEIAAMQPVTNEDILRRIPGIRITHVRKQTTITPGKAIRDTVPEGTYIVGRRGVSSAEAPCTYDVYIDGVKGLPTDLVRISVQTIQELEVHSPSTLPPRYKATCGALLVWTKST